MTKILTDLAVDDPLVQDANYRFDSADRQYIDEQIRGIETHLVNALIRGRQATYFRVSTLSPALAPGDAVCIYDVVGGELTVGKALSAHLTPSNLVGVCVLAAAPGSNALVAIGGVLPPSVTGIQTGFDGYAYVDGGTGRLFVVIGNPASGDIVAGRVDVSGYVRISPYTGAGVADNSQVISPTLAYGGADVLESANPYYTAGGFGVRVVNTSLLDDGNPDVNGFVLQTLTSMTTTSASAGQQVATVIVQPGEFVALDAFVTCRQGSTGGRWKRSVCYQRVGTAAPTIVGTLESGTDQGTGGSVTVSVSGTNIVAVAVTPSDTNTRIWLCELRTQHQPAV